MKYYNNFNIALVGIGNIGSSIYNYLVKKKNYLTSQTGSNYNLKYVSAKNFKKKRFLQNIKKKWFSNPLELAQKDDVDIIIELIGGSEGMAKKIVFSALRNKKHVITANKELIFKYGNELAKIAQENKVNLLFEASVGGGIPIIKSIKESLNSNNIFHIYGILNGTTNFILTEIEKTKKSFSTILIESIKKGYAEPNPIKDLNGEDVKSKLSILSGLCFKSGISNHKFEVQGIQNIDYLDIEYAKEFKLKIKLLAISEIINNKIKLRVHPSLIPENSDLAKIDGVNNAIVIEGQPVGKIVYQGLGAGKGPTTSSVISDLTSVLKNEISLPFGYDINKVKKFKTFDFNNHQSKYYLRLTVQDKAGVLSIITNILSSSNVSIQRIIQNPINFNQASIVIITHKCMEKNIKKTIQKISYKNFIVKKIVMIRIRDEKKL